MTKARIEAFSDGVVAILITIMVLELKVPLAAGPDALSPMIPVLLCYLLSFVFLGIYWSNHHHLFQAVKKVDGRILWANLHLLFWLSLVPFVTAWMGENGFATWPVACYGIVLLCAAIAYYVLSLALLALHGPDSLLAVALGNDLKGKISLVIYVMAILIAFFWSWLSCLLYVVVAIIWLVPDKRIENILAG
jgi:uncharacterized membrane protein